MRGAGWVVEGVEIGSDVGREFGGGHAPIDNLGVGVAEWFHVPGCCGGV